MKKIILAACILIFPNLLTYGQIHETWGDLLFEDTLSMNPLNEWITIPFPDENGWQTGELYKDFFDSTLSENHFIITDTLNSYPAAEIFVFPNPAPDYINIYIPHNIGCDRISIFNTQGQVVLQKEIYSSETLDLSALTEGIYHYCLYHAESLIKAGSFVKK